MRRTAAFILAVSALGLLPTGKAAAADQAAAGEYYCPPGAKFCPAPGTNNTVFLDTHFGMDAKTGEVLAYKGTQHPDDVLNPPMTGEQVLYTAPPISVENRFVPYPGAPQTNMTGTTVAVTHTPPQPVAQTAVYRAGPVQARPVRRADAESEVAYNQTARTGVKEPTEKAAGEIPWWKGGWWRNSDSETAMPRDQWEDSITDGDKVPWWKGGMWRNRKGDKPDGGKGAGRSSGGPSALAADDDMWGDDDYSGYDPNSGFGGQQRQPAGDPYATPSFGGQPQYGDPYTAPAFGSDPYAAPATQYASQPQYGTPYAPAPTTGYVGDAYTVPNSPPPTSPYQQGYVYPGTDISYESTYQGGYPQQQVYTATPTYQDPYAQQQMYAAAPVSMDAGGFLPPPPAAAQSYQEPPPAPESFGSPQFENAVQMVKENRFSEAKSLLLNETSRNPGNAAAWRWLGDCHYNLLELDDAIGSYQRALDRDPNDYYALRGQGFSYLHRGHEYWRRMQEEVARGEKEAAAATFSQAHDNYKKSLELLGLCLRRAPNDGEAIYGEAMAAEGASRKLYSNAISYLKLNDQRERAELFAENCLTVINKGIERANERAKMNPGESGPRALLGGLYLRKAILYQQLGKNDLALVELKSSRDVQQSILDEIDKNNATAQKGVRECEGYWEAWGGGRM